MVSVSVCIANLSNREHMDKVYLFGADLTEEKNSIHARKHHCMYEFWLQYSERLLHLMRCMRSPA